ncbi:MAG: hypothetical protein J6R47_06230, partial [Acholeplasmatales bacterium]|nr:hypothetical protein [Acholeplasmatales bacterium]
EGAYVVPVNSTSQGGSTYVFSQDNMTVTSTHGSSMNQWGRFNFTALSESYTNAMMIIKGEGMALCVKLDANNPNNTYDGKAGNKQYKTLDGYTIFDWNLAELGMDATILEKAVFWAYDPKGSTSGTFELIAIAFYNEVAEEDPVDPEQPNVELPEGAFVVTVTSNSQGGTTYVFSEDKMSVTTTHTSSANQWGRFNFAALSEDYTNAMIIVKGEGMALGMKLDANNPNNTYDGKTGNKQYKALDGITTFEWNLAELGMKATILEKAVFWPYDPNGSTTGTFEVLAIAFYNVEPELEANQLKVLSTGNDDSALMVENTEAKVLYSTTGSWNFANGWRLYIVVDAEGKICYMLHSPTSGYGNVAETSYIRHSDYAVPASNPAFTNIGSEPYNQWGSLHFDLVIPQGGFAICAYDSEGEASKLTQLILGIDCSVSINTNANNVDKIRLAYDAEAGIITVTEDEQQQSTSIDAPIKGVAQGGKTYTFTNENKTVECTYGTSMSQWGRWDINKVSSEYTKVTVVVKATSDFALAMKVDSATTPGNNAYDGVSGNKQYKKLTAGEEVTFTWDLAALNIPAENLEKLVFWAYDSTGATTSGTFELVSFTFSN